MGLHLVHRHIVESLTRDSCLLQNISFQQYSLHLWVWRRTHERKRNLAYYKNLWGNALRETYPDLWHIDSFSETLPMTTHLHLHFREYQRLMRRNGTDIILWWKDRQIYTLFSTTTNSLEISAHSYNHFDRYKMSLKQNLHYKNIMIEINATHWEIKLILFSWTYDTDIIDVGFINLVHIFLLLPCGSVDFIWYVAHWSEVAWVFSFFDKGHWYFSPEPWMRIRTHSHQWPWLLWYNISICKSCWVLVSIIHLGTLCGALSPGVLYIGYQLISNFINIQIVSFTLF